MSRFNSPPLRLNNPWEGFVKVEALLSSGKVHLHLRNDHHRPVSLTQLSLLVASEKGPIALLAKPLDLLPADSHYLEIGDTLKPFFRQTPDAHERMVTILLAVEPELPDQPEHFSFRIRFGNDRFLALSSVPTRSEKE